MKTSFQLLLLTILAPLYLEAQECDTICTSRWSISINTALANTTGDGFIVLNPQIQYSYASDKFISLGAIVYDGIRGQKIFMTLNGFDTLTRGIRNGITVGHSWKFFYNEKIKLYGIASANLWYLQGDIAYDRLRNSDDPLTFYAPSALYEIFEIGIQKKFGKLKRLGLQLNVNTGVGYVYGTNIWKRLAIVGSSFRIGYAF